MSTSPRRRPERLYPRGRAVVSEFDPVERLYRRYTRDQWVNGQLAIAAIAFHSKSGVSVNRSKFSEPEDVLFHESGEYDDWGVVGFGVVDIPPRVDPDRNKGEDGPSYLFRPEHVPLDSESNPQDKEINYAHSEIWSQRSDAAQIPGPYKPPSKTVGMSFRIRLCQKIREEQVLRVAIR